MFDKLWKISISVCLLAIAVALCAGQWQEYHERKAKESQAAAVQIIQGNVAPLVQEKSISPPPTCDTHSAGSCS